MKKNKLMIIIIAVAAAVAVAGVVFYMLYGKDKVRAFIEKKRKKADDVIGCDDIDALCDECVEA
ncbi:MAG: hypothetical protein UH851_02090 [Clostridia bacterium]|nr:hypothetical protein [Clostridia bacterium]